MVVINKTIDEHISHPEAVDYHYHHSTTNQQDYKEIEDLEVATASAPGKTVTKMPLFGDDEIINFKDLL